MGCNNSKTESITGSPKTQLVTVKKVEQPSPGGAKADKEFDVLFKILLLGDSGVGKSSLMLRFADGTFKSTLSSTIGIDFKLRTVEVDGKRVRIQIWDTAGQEKFKTITASYYRGAQGYILTYDITNYESFEHVKHWIEEIEKYGLADVPKCIVGNKSDLEGTRVVPFDQARRFASERDLPFVETSAKDGTQVNELFVEMARRALRYTNLL